MLNLKELSVLYMTIFIFIFSLGQSSHYLIRCPCFVQDSPVRSASNSV
jgi:hypothetical protein